MVIAITIVVVLIIVAFLALFGNWLIGSKPIPPVPTPTPPEPPVPTPTPVPPTVPPVPGFRQVIAWINGAGALSTADFTKIVEALNLQIVHLAAAWPNMVGLNTTNIIATATTVPDGAWPAYFLPNADVAGALGYHDVDPQGRPYSRVFVDTVLNNGGTVLSGNLTLSSVASHEMCEVLVDPSCTGYSTPEANGNTIALEVGDPVETYSYTVTLSDGTAVDVSDFVFPSFFSLDGKMPYDQMQIAPSPFQIMPGGYEIVKDPSGNVTQVFGEISQPAAWRLATKDHPASRTYKRLHNA